MAKSMRLSVSAYARPSAVSLVNGSPPKPFAVTTSNFAGALTKLSKGHCATFCVNLRSRSKVAICQKVKA